MELKFLVVIIISFLTAFLFAPFYIGLLFKFNIRRMSKPFDDELVDRSLKFGTPVMGGLIITLPVLLLSFTFLRSWNMFIPFSLVLVLGSLLGALDEFVNTIGRKGFSFAVREAVDSVVSKNAFAWKVYKLLLIPWEVFKEAFRVMGSTQKGIRAHEKFLMQSVVALIGAAFIYFGRGGEFWLPLVGFLDFGIFYLPLILVLALFFANAFGITDGMDGLSAGMHTVSFLAYGALALIFGFPNLALFCALIVGAELAFLYFNVYPARVEMSDVGTLPLGMLLVFIAAAMQREFSLFFVGFIYVVEIVSSLLQQWSAKLRHGKRLFLLAPLHHHFEKKGWHETKVTSRFWLANGIFAIVGMIVALL